MDSFDERDLLEEFERAGFRTITLTYEHHDERAHRGARWEARTFLSTRPNPGTISYEEAAREVLGEGGGSSPGAFCVDPDRARYRLRWAVGYVAAVK